METERLTPEENKQQFFEDIKILVSSVILQRNNKEATELITSFIKNNFYLQTLRHDEKTEIWIYKDGIYLPNGKSYVEELCRTILRDNYNNRFRNEVIIKLTADTYIDQETFFTKQNDHINIIPVINGLLNIETKELKPFSPNIFFFNKLPVFFEPGRECPKILGFLRSVLANNDDVLTIQELFGFSMLKEYRYEKSFMMIGGGRNGKGKLIDLLKRFLGYENCANLSLRKIEKDGFSICELQNKLINISGDIGKHALEDTSEFKALTGRDMIHASRKFKTMIKFENYAKMIFATNELPKSSDMTSAFFQRWEIINFPYTFFNPIDYELYKGDRFARLRNPNIIRDILSPEELSGLLNWALLGLERLQELKVFTTTKSSDYVRRDWICRSDSALSFVNELLVDNYENFLSWSLLKSTYKDYCSVNGLKMLNDKDLRVAITDNTVAISSRQYLGDKQVRGYDGVSWRKLGVVVEEVTF